MIIGKPEVENPRKVLDNADDISATKRGCAQTETNSSPIGTAKLGEAYREHRKRETRRLEYKRK